RGNVIVNSSDSEFVHPYLKETFDKILLDVPCSGSAMFRKNALSEKDWSQAKVARCAKTQRKLLDHAASMLKPGGTIMYSTCSFSYEENEGNLLSFLDAHPEFEAAPLPLDHPGFYHSSALPEAIYLFPHRFRGEGQFACLLRKKGAHEPSSLAPKSALIARKYRDFLSQYGLERRSNEEKRGKFYSLTLAFDTGHLNTLRYGVKLFEMRETFLPDHALARYLGNEFSIPLEEKEARLFLHGDVFPLDKPDGFFVVSYAGFNLGWVKVTKGQAKNHYPKGLRHTYPGALL
ncbi:MAG: hypothetical protein HUJ60_06815, partial [Bacilli bacterium]|nr:hypothetical protein [Bacilli bacterium]